MGCKSKCGYAKDHGNRHIASLAKHHYRTSKISTYTTKATRWKRKKFKLERRV
jgi:hypothetical protein